MLKVILKSLKLCLYELKLVGKAIAICSGKHSLHNCYAYRRVTLSKSAFILEHLNKYNIFTMGRRNHKMSAVKKENLHGDGYRAVPLHV